MEGIFIEIYVILEIKILFILFFDLLYRFFYLFIGIYKGQDRVKIIYFRRINECILCQDLYCSEYFYNGIVYVDVLNGLVFFFYRRVNMKIFFMVYKVFYSFLCVSQFIFYFERICLYIGFVFCYR